MKLEAIFQSKMIFQREKPIRIFGTGEGTANATLCGVSASSVRTEKGWLITLPPMPAGGPYTLFLDLNGERKELNDVLIGEVFLASGQSNMEMPLFRTEGGFDEAGLAKDDEIRLYTVPRRLVDGQPNWNRHFESLYSTDTEWQKCTEDSALHFSAIGYYFAKEMRAALGVPVGIVSCNWGGCVLRSFVPRDAFASLPPLRPELERVDAIASGYTEEEQTRLLAEFLRDMEKQCRESLDTFENTRIGGSYYAVAHDAMGFHAKPLPLIPCSPNYPGHNWETMVRHLVPFSFRGVLWYQGESECESLLYFEKYKLLLDTWREQFLDPELPFIAAELAPTYRCSRFQQQSDIKGFAFLREQQQRAADELPNSYLATLVDCGDPADIHPCDKRTPAHRMWLLAYRYLFGENVVADAPRFERIAFSPEGEALLFFRNAKKLFVSAPRDFWIAGEDGIFYPAAVSIAGDTVLRLRSPRVPEPKYVRYAFFDYPHVGFLYNEGGLPLMPFRTDRLTRASHRTETA